MYTFASPKQLWELARKVIIKRQKYKAVVRTVLQSGQFAALKEREFLEILMILSNFKPKKSTFWPFFIENWSKIHKIGGFGCKKSTKFEENPIINFYSLVSAAN